MARRLKCVDRICPAFLLSGQRLKNSCRKTCELRCRNIFRRFRRGAEERRKEKNERKTNFKNAGDTARVYDGIHIDTWQEEKGLQPESALMLQLWLTIQTRAKEPSHKISK